MSDVRLYRGKVLRGKKRGQWFFGSYIENSIDSPCIIDNDAEQWEVIPETVGQDTGKKDKKGNAIFEGDIDKRGFKVVWRQELASYELWDGTDRFICLNPYNTGAIEIIGTIHDEV